MDGQSADVSAAANAVELSRGAPELRRVGMGCSATAPPKLVGDVVVLPMDSRGAGCGQLPELLLWLAGVSADVGAVAPVTVPAGFATVASVVAMFTSWSNLLRASGTGSSTGLILRSLFLLKFSLFLRKSGSSKLISVPRWSSSLERCARFRPSSRSANYNHKFMLELASFVPSIL